MELRLKKLFIKLLIKINSKIILINGKLNFWKVKFDEHISLDDNVFISPTATIESRFGGKIKIEKNTEILDDVKILTYGGNIKIGSNCSINAGTIIYGHGNTLIGNDVLIAGGCMLIPANHRFKNIDIKISNQGLELSPIIIEDNVWIAHGCSILSGVTIRKGTVVAAGSVVNKSFPEFSVIGGVPAKLLKSRI